MFSRSTFFGLAALLCLGLLSGCGGYQWVTDRGIAGTRTQVAVPVFINETPEPFLAEILTAAVRSRFLAGGVRVAPSGLPALNGRIMRVADAVLAFDADGIASHRRVVVTVRAALAGGSGELWTDRPFVGSAEYPVTSDPTFNRDARDRALEEAATGIATQLLLALDTYRESK